MSIISLDFETYYDTECSLKRLTYLEYINHPKFKVHMLGIRMDDQIVEVVENKDVEEALHSYFPPGNDHIMVGHNLMFDGLICEAKYGITAKEYHDTQAMFRGIAPYMPTSLDAMTKALFPDTELKKGTELEQSKGVYHLPEELYKIISVYCANDVELTHKAYEAMLGYFPEEELEIISDTLRMWIEPRLRLDQERVTRHLSQLTAQKKQILQESGLPKTTLSSNPKFAAWIEEHDMTVPRKLNAKKKVTYALAKDDLEFIALRNEHPEHKAIWDARISVKSTIEETRAERMLRNSELDNGLLRAPLNYYGAHTGRYSGTQKINLQNLQRGSELRLSLCARDDNEYIYVSDLSQIEARMNAWLSGEDDLILDFANGVDIYSKFASEHIYGKPIDKNENPLERFVGKVAILGLGYGMSGNKFRETLAKGSMGPPVFLTEEQADDVVYRGYRKTYRNIVRNWKTGDHVIQNMIHGEQFQWGPMYVYPNRIELPNGMFLNYPNLKVTEFPDGVQTEYWNGKFMTNIYGGKLVENVVQALARIVVMQQLLKIKKMMPHLKYALQVHDELIFTGPKANADQTMADIIGYMSEPPAWCASLPVAAEGGYDVNYSK